jgi:hypothetical protein
MTLRRDSVKKVSMIFLVSVIDVLGRETACQLRSAGLTHNSEFVVDWKNPSEKDVRGDLVDIESLRSLACRKVDTVFWLPNINLWVLSNTSQEW